MQGGYVSQSQGQQLSVTKKSNVLDKGKPNSLNSAAKKLNQNHSNESSNNNNNNNNAGSDINDSGTHKTSHHYERDPSPPAPAPAPVVPEVTVRFQLLFELLAKKWKSGFKLYPKWIQIN